MKTVIIIPARYGSSRLPGKPLKPIAGVPMLERVLRQAQKAAEGLADVAIYVATEDQRIYDYAQSIGANVVMTSDDCASGSDRAYQAVQQLDHTPEVILNLQGDVPLADPKHIRQIIVALQADSGRQVATPVVRLTWQALDALIEQKRETPFSGTTVTIKSDGQAHWFSKQIIPAIRKRAQFEAADPVYSPVYKHIGLYGYRWAALERFVQLPEGSYERLEGLEQLRLLENDIPIHCVPVDTGTFPLGIGVDTEQDVQRVEALIEQYGDPYQAEQEL